MRRRRRRRSVEPMNAVDAPQLPRLSERVLDALLEEIRRYLEVVELFRAEGREPRWS
jgi:hypothetical protein